MDLQLEKWDILTMTIKIVTDANNQQKSAEPHKAQTWDLGRFKEPEVLH